MFARLPFVFAALEACTFALPSHVSRATSYTAANFCGAPNDYQVIADTPWIVFSMNYNYQSIEGSCCTGFGGVTGTGSEQTIQWNSTWDISKDTDPDVVKGKQAHGV
jgi:xyloglucan-specific endo-beta-1,4-glucanase